METWTTRRGANGSLDTGRPLDAAHGRDGEAGRVLIVDDDASVRLVCAVNLKAEGLHVSEAADGLDALEQARRERPDLVLTDVAMPGLDGFQLAERLRGDEPNPRAAGDLSERRGRAGERTASSRARGGRVLGEAVRPTRARRVRRARTRGRASRSR
jgi:CheY-like chemotaxis protein